jgi:putative ABC transport system permease protein
MNLWPLWRIVARARHYYLTVVGSLMLLLTMVFVVFSLIAVVYWQSLPYKDSAHLYWLEGTLAYQGSTTTGTNPNNLRYVGNNSRSLSAWAGYYSWSDYKLTGLTERPSVPVFMASHNVFEVLGTSAQLGRLFSALEAEGNQQPSAVLSDAVWRRYFAADPEIVGKKLQLNQRSFTIVGVTAADLVLPQNPLAAEAIWLPFDMDEQFSVQQFAGYAGGLKAVVRLNDAVSAKQAEQELSELMLKAAALHTPDLAAEYPAGARLSSFSDAVRGDSGRLVLMLLAGVMLLTLIGLVNLSSLQLARAAGRQQQMAICAAFGATRRQLFRQVLQHNLLMVSVAALLALLLSWSCFGLIADFAGDTIPRVNELSISGPVLLAVLLSVLLMVVLLSLAELSAINPDALQQTLQSSGKGVGRQIRHGVSHSLIGLQLCLSLLILVASTHVVRHTLHEAWRPTGVHTDGLWSLQLNLAAITDAKTRQNVMQGVLAELKKLPGLQQVSYSSEPRIPLVLNFESVRNALGEVLTSARVIWQDDQQLPLYQLSVEGQSFQAQELDGGSNTVLINQRLAAMLPKPVTGQKLSLPHSDQLYGIRGIVADTAFPGASHLEVPEVYLPGRYQQERSAALLMQFSDDASVPALAALYQVLQPVSPVLDVLSYTAVNAEFAGMSHKLRFAALIAGALALVSVTMVAAGVWGIVNYLLRLKKFELGVRQAFGASQRQLLQEQLSMLAKPVLTALCFSACLVLFLAGWSRTQPDWQLQLDAPLFTLNLTLLLALAAAACWVPLRQILTAEPMRALRHD